MGNGIETVIMVLFITSWLCLLSEAIWVEIPQKTGTKCILEEIHGKVVAVGSYWVLFDEHEGYSPSVIVKVTSPWGTELHHQENVTNGQFAFTSKEDGIYTACFWLHNYQDSSDVTLNLEWKTGIAAKDWESVARKEKLEGVELELRKLEGSVEAIQENLAYVMAREHAIREVSEKTNARVAWYSIMSLGICIVVSVTHLWYLKRYFRKKKLI